MFMTSASAVFKYWYAGHPGITSREVNCRNISYAREDGRPRDMHRTTGRQGDKRHEYND
jgi:hypothetical protein